MDISFIIPTYNEGRYIGKTLESLHSQMDGKRHEIVIVDSYSTDSTVKIAKKYTDRIFFLPRNGVGLARTFGAKKARGKVVAFLDADGVPAPGWLSAIERAFKEDIHCVCGLDLYEHTELSLYNVYALLTHWLANIAHKVFNVKWAPSNNCAILKEHFLKIGGYKSVMLEDVELGRRMKSSRMKRSSEMLVLLSDRRFRKEGFWKTLAIWLKANVDIIIFNKVPLYPVVSGDSKNYTDVR